MYIIYTYMHDGAEEGCKEEAAAMVAQVYGHCTLWCSHTNCSLHKSVLGGWTSWFESQHTRLKATYQITCKWIISSFSLITIQLWTDVCKCITFFPRVLLQLCNNLRILLFFFLHIPLQLCNYRYKYIIHLFNFAMI